MTKRVISARQAQQHNDITDRYASEKEQMLAQIEAQLAEETRQWRVRVRAEWEALSVVELTLHAILTSSADPDEVERLAWLALDATLILEGREEYG